MRAKQLSQSAFIQDLALRLYQKGVITAADGGFLTPFGVSLLEYLDHLLNALTDEVAA